MVEGLDSEDLENDQRHFWQRRSSGQRKQKNNVTIGR